MESIGKVYNKKAILSNCLVIGLFVLVLVLLSIQPKKYSAIVFEGLLLWATCVLPSLFPFILLTTIFSKTKAARSMGKVFEMPMRKLYGVGGDGFFIIFMSMLSGYPAAPKLIESAYSSGSVNLSEAKRILAVASPCSPAFLIGTVASGFFGNAGLGLIMYAAITAGGLLNGFIYKIAVKKQPHSANESVRQNIDFLSNISKSVYDSVITVAVIGGYIAVFYLLSQILTDIKVMVIIQKIFGLFTDEELSKGISYSLIEITMGAKILSPSALSPLLISICVFLMTMGGASITVQSMSFLGKCGIKTRFYLLCKLTHGIIAAILSYILALIVY